MRRRAGGRAGRPQQAARAAGPAAQTTATTQIAPPNAQQTQIPLTGKDGHKEDDSCTAKWVGGWARDIARRCMHWEGWEWRSTHATLQRLACAQPRPAPHRTRLVLDAARPRRVHVTVQPGQHEANDDSLTHGDDLRVARGMCAK